MQKAAVFRLLLSGLYIMLAVSESGGQSDSCGTDLSIIPILMGTGTAFAINASRRTFSTATVSRLEALEALTTPRNGRTAPYQY